MTILVKCYDCTTELVWNNPKQTDVRSCIVCGEENALPPGSLDGVKKSGTVINGVMG